MLEQTIRTDLATAMKSGDTFRRNTLRMILSEIKAGQVATAKLEPIEAVKDYRKRLVKSIDAFVTQPDKVAALTKEIEVIDDYLPKAAPVGEVQAFIKTVDLTNFGKAMKQVKDTFPDNPGAELAQLVKTAIAEL